MRRRQVDDYSKAIVISTKDGNNESTDSDRCVVRFRLTMVLSGWLQFGVIDAGTEWRAGDRRSLAIV
jgi:hypothetical protein